MEWISSRLLRRAYTVRPVAGSYCVMMLMAFLSVLITYFGVNLFLGGMHAYA